MPTPEYEFRAVENIFNLDSTTIQNHEAIATLYSCVRLISNTIASIELKHLNLDGEEIINSPTTKLIKSPQENKTYYSWMNDMVYDFILRGNAYAIIADKELIYVPSSSVQIYITHQPESPYYYQISHNGKSHNVFPEDIVHFKNVSPDGIIGISPLTQFKNTFDSAASMADYSANFVKNSASVGGVLKTEKKLKKETIEELRLGFSDRFSGVDNAGRIPILHDGFDFKEIKRISPTDMDFINNYKLTKANIAEIFQVPLSMLGTSDLSYNNAESNALMFQNYTVNPLLRSIEQELSLKLIPIRSKDRLKFLVDTLQNASTKEKADSLSLLVNTGIFTPNEARKRYGLTSIKGGDELIKKDNQIGKEAQAPKENTPEGTNTPANQPPPPSKRSIDE